MKIYLLRHGETNENKNKYYYGKMDVSLNEKGIEQGKRAHIALKNIDFNTVFISERKRTRETADLVLGSKDVKIIMDNRINEMDFGEFEGKNYEDIKKQYPEEYKVWEENWKEFTPPYGESYMQFYHRIKCFMDDILKLPDEDILIVTHGGVIRTIYSYILGGNMDFFWKFSSKNGDISIIKYQYGNIFIDSISHI